MTNIEFENLWHYKIVNIGNKDILLGNIILATLMLTIGVYLYNKLLPKFTKYLQQKEYKENTNDFYLLQRICTYLIVLIYMGIVLDIANIPLTTFAFLGGAIALSIGLGAQNLIGSFLNGFLVILDKSLNIGDIVKIENIIGKVKSIGIRSTIIQTSDNTEMVIPNSNIINSNLTKFISDKSFLKAKIYFKIEVPNYKDNNVEAKILEALGLLEQISNELLPEIYLIEVTQKTYKYLLCYYPKTFGKYSKEYIQHLVNHALIEKLDNSKLETRIM